MTVQTTSLLVSLAAIVALAAVFLRVRALSHTPVDYPPLLARAYRLGRIALWTMVVVGLPVTVWLLRYMPHTTAAAVADPQVVNVSSTQWFWEFDRESVEASKPVEFHVTSTDVNHGFGLYDPSGRMVAQVQAMPGYINVMTHTFEAPGDYRVLCLEYCGLAHHAMESVITVTAAGGSNG